MEKRKTNLDYLRILAMMFIILHHCIVNDFGLQDLLKNHMYVGEQKINEVIVLGFLNSCVVVGVNIFFLLSGYLEIRFKWKKIISLVIKIYIIYWLIAVSGLLTGHLIIDFEFIKNILDPLDMYWFIMTYILLYFASPLLNMIVESISVKSSKKYFIGICLICFIYGFFIDARLHILNGYSFLMAIILYIMGGIIRRWEVRIKNKVSFLAYFLCAMANTIVVILCYVCGKGNYAWKMYSYNNLLIVIESVALLFIFLNKKQCKEMKIINKFATGTITVYLLHSTCWLSQMRYLPIEYLINLKGFYFAVLLLPLYALMIYSVCIIFDCMYNKTFGTYLNPGIDKISKIVEKIIEKII